MGQKYPSTTLPTTRSKSVGPALRHRIALPEPSLAYDQDAEWLVLHSADSGWREIRFHDYAEIYELPGLYEQIFYEILKCSSPKFMSDFLRIELEFAGVAPNQLRVLDLGAGNGIMGEELRKLGVNFVIGVDILESAARAAARDRPGIYDEYHVVDMTALPADRLRIMRGYRFNALTCIAALGFGDIPPACLRAAFNLLADGGWLVFTIKEGFLSESDHSGFSALLKAAVRDGSLEVVGTEVYQHRLATNGTPLYYTGVVARKLADLEPPGRTPA
ncbi:MAG: methyltransferase domain-containing protein [Pseudonocardia sp.]|nr:methyltransferase domain-containing protein [Pseudonocardia sp.]